MLLKIDFVSKPLEARGKILKKITQNWGFTSMKFKLLMQISDLKCYLCGL